MRLNDQRAAWGSECICACTHRPLCLAFVAAQDSNFLLQTRDDAIPQLHLRTARRTTAVIGKCVVCARNRHAPWLPFCQKRISAGRTQNPQACLVFQVGYECWDLERALRRGHEERYFLLCFVCAQLLLLEFYLWLRAQAGVLSFISAAPSGQPERRTRERSAVHLERQYGVFQLAIIPAQCARARATVRARPWTTKRADKAGRRKGTSTAAPSTAGGLALWRWGQPTALLLHLH